VKSLAGDKVADGRFADGRDEKQLIQLFDSLAWWVALTTARAADSRT
jgi:hypothetical protein